jgi:serine-type D-Ala-D-Ala endopeptidase (penicillin-binding protein 7)
MTTKNMSKKTSDFFFSFGIMMLGMVFLFIGSIGFTSSPVGNFASKLPRSKPRQPLPGGDVQAAVLPISKPSVPLSKFGAKAAPEFSALSAMVIDDSTGEVLYKKNSKVIHPLASITKLMSALVLRDLDMDWSKKIIITEAQDDSTSHHIKSGEKFELADLLNVALVGSSNTAIRALVAHSGLTQEEFVAKMNSKADQNRWGSLKFVETTGLEAGNIGSAHDTARLLKDALQNERIVEALQTPEYYASPLEQEKRRRVWSTNWLLSKWIPSTFDKDDIVGKTGYIAESGYNFVVRLNSNSGRTVRVVILGAVSNEARFIEARDLANWAFNNFLWPDDAGYGELTE